MIADIAHGHVAGADICFLIAVILFGLTTILRLATPVKAVDAILMAAGATCLALAWLIL